MTATAQNLSFRDRQEAAARDPFVALGEIPAGWKPVLEAQKAYQALVDEKETLTGKLERLRSVAADLARPMGLDVPDPMEKARALNEEIIAAHLRLAQLDREIEAAEARRREALAKGAPKFLADEEEALRSKLIPAFEKAVDDLEARLADVNAAVWRIRLLQGEEPRKIRSYHSIETGKLLDDSNWMGLEKVFAGFRGLAERIDTDLKPNAETFLAESAEGLSRRVRPNVPLSMGGQRA